MQFVQQSKSPFKPSVKAERGDSCSPNRLSPTRQLSNKIGGGDAILVASKGVRVSQQLKKQDYQSFEHQGHPKLVQTDRFPATLKNDNKRMKGLAQESSGVPKSNKKKESSTIAGTNVAKTYREIQEEALEARTLARFPYLNNIKVPTDRQSPSFEIVDMSKTQNIQQDRTISKSVFAYTRPNLERLTKRQANLHSTVAQQAAQDFLNSDINNSAHQSKMGKNLYEAVPKHMSYIEDDMSELYEHIGDVPREDFLRASQEMHNGLKSSLIRNTVSSNLRAASCIDQVKSLKNKPTDNSTLITSQAQMTIAEKAAIAATNFPLNRVTPLLRTGQPGQVSKTSYDFRGLQNLKNESSTRLRAGSSIAVLQSLPQLGANHTYSTFVGDQPQRVNMGPGATTSLFAGRNSSINESQGEVSAKRSIGPMSRFEQQDNFAAQMRETTFSNYKKLNRKMNKMYLNLSEQYGSSRKFLKMDEAEVKRLAGQAKLNPQDQIKKVTLYQQMFQTMNTLHGEQQRMNSEASCKLSSRLREDRHHATSKRHQSIASFDKQGISPTLQTDHYEE